MKSYTRFILSAESLRVSILMISDLFLVLLSLNKFRRLKFAEVSYHTLDILTLFDGVSFMRAYSSMRAKLVIITEIIVIYLHNICIFMVPTDCIFPNKRHDQQRTLKIGNK